MDWLNADLITLTKTGSGIDSIRLLEEGKVDGIDLRRAKILRIRQNGIPLAVFPICDISAGADMLLARPSIKHMSDLKGQRIAVEKIALGELSSTRYCRLRGLNERCDSCVALSRRATKRMAAHFKLPPEEVLSTFKGLVLPDLDNNLRLLVGAIPVALSNACIIADTMLKSGLLQRMADLTLLAYNYGQLQSAVGARRGHLYPRRAHRRGFQPIRLAVEILDQET